MKYRIYTSVALSFAGVCILGRANIQAEEGKFVSLEQRVEVLEKRINEGGSSPLSSILSQQKLGILLQLQGIHNETSGVVDNFKGRRAEIKLSGSVIPKNLSYAVMIDPFLSGNITKDAFVMITYIPYMDGQFGQYKFPQSLEGRWSSGDLDFIERATVSGIFGDKRDFGIQLSNTKISLASVRIEYGIGLFNGSGQNTSDNNSHKDFAGRFGFEWKGLWLGTNGYLGQEPTGERTRVGGEFRYVCGSAKLQGEYLSGLTEKSSGGVSTRQEGYYVLTNYVWKSLRPGIRWESWDADDTVKKRQDSLTGGLDYLFSQDKKNKLSINYIARFEETTQIANNELLTQIQVIF